MARERKRDKARAELPTPLLRWRQIKPAFERVAGIIQTFAAWIAPADAIRGLQLP
jgi:hypothetical protein